MRTPTQQHGSPVAAPPAPARYPIVDAVGIAALAFVLRFGIVLFSNGGPGGLYGYDAGVYYSAADALTFGRVPYRDFIFLHPPGLMLALAPFAVLGRLTSDHVGYEIANLFFNLLAAVNAVLVWRIAGRWGLSRRTALIGGLFYAVWWGAVNAEIGLRLEPLGTFCFLVGLLLLTGDGRVRRVAAGVALGLTVGVKIWWIVPVLIVVGWHLLRPEGRRRLDLAAGAAAGLLLVYGPFFALAPGQMWHRVVTDQLGRNYVTSPVTRLESTAGLSRALPSASSAVMAVLVVVVGAVFVAAMVAAWRRPVARLIVVVLAAQFVVLMVSPSFFGFYSGYLPAALSLTVAAASEPLVRRVRLDHRVGWTAAGLAAVLTLGALVHSSNLVAPFPGRTFERATAGLRCVMVDSNSALILMNRLSDDFAHGCPNWVDVTGHTYFGKAHSADQPRAQNRVWQRYLQRYLLSGDAAMIIRPNGTFPSVATKRLLAQHPVLVRRHRYVLYRITH